MIRAVVVAEEVVAVTKAKAVETLKGIFALMLVIGLITLMVRCQQWVDDREWRDNCKMKYETVECHEAKIEMIKAKKEYQKKIEGIKNDEVR